MNEEAEAGRTARGLHAHDASHRVHVAAAAIFDPGGRVLLALRPAHLHQGGLWEFPGGKVEPDEPVLAALGRELHEELGITVQAARPLIRVHHDYPDKSVLLDVWRVDQYTGVPHGREGQAIRWVAPDALPEYSMPAANLPIVTAARLPDTCLVTGAFRDPADCLARLRRALELGVRLVQLRAHWLEPAALRALAGDAAALCHRHGARLLLNGTAADAQAAGADGVHFNSARLMAATARPALQWVSASVHNAVELAQAQRLGLDFVLAAPVQATATHPGAPVLGWDGLQDLTEQARMPVYALGGLAPADLPRAFAYGAQGIAAIGALWG